VEPLVGPSTFQPGHLVRWRRSDQITNNYQTLSRDAAVGNGGIDGSAPRTAATTAQQGTTDAQTPIAIG
jgi:hypothetical protein